VHVSRSEDTRRILIAAGGTGGHITPALAIGETLCEKYGSDVCVNYVTGSRDIEKRVFNQAEKFPDHLPCDRAPALSAKGFGRGMKIIQSTWMAAKLITKFKPHAILATGGYVCAPVLFSARMMGVPYYLHDSNSVPGKVTRTFARKAHGVFLGSDLSQERLTYPLNSIFTGTPVRPDLLNRTRYDALRRLNLKKDQFGILVLGGSQGARAVNDVIFDMVQRLNEESFSNRSYNLIWCTGPLNCQSMEQRLSDAGISNENIHLTEYLDDMASGYAACDLVISRAGAGTISEIAATQKPSVLIPYPTAADNHQFLNAKEMRDLGASIIVEESDLTAKRLISHVIDLMDSEKRRNVMKICCDGKSCLEGIDIIHRALMMNQRIDTSPNKRLAA